MVKSSAPNPKILSDTTHESFCSWESPRTASDRSFGLVFAVLFTTIGALPHFNERPSRPWAFALAGGFALVGWLKPELLAPINRAWTRLGLLLHRVTSPLVLGIVFFGVVTPIGVLLRIFGKDPLHLRADAQRTSYWNEQTPPGPTPESMKFQF